MRVNRPMSLKLIVVFLNLFAADIFKKMGRGNSRAQVSVEDVSTLCTLLLLFQITHFTDKEIALVCMNHSTVYTVTVILL